MPGESGGCVVSPLERKLKKKKRKNEKWKKKKEARCPHHSTAGPAMQSP